MKKQINSDVFRRLAVEGNPNRIVVEHGAIQVAHLEAIEEELLKTNALLAELVKTNQQLLVVLTPVPEPPQPLAQAVGEPEETPVPESTTPVEEAPAQQS